MKKTRLLFINRSYWPDGDSSGPAMKSLCEDLTGDFDIEVVTGRSQDTQASHQASTVGHIRRNGVTIHRLLNTTFPEFSTVGGLINRTTFAITSFLAVLWKSPRPDVVVVQTDSPGLSILGRFIKWRYSIPFVAYQLDRPLKSASATNSSWHVWMARLGCRLSVKSCNHADRVIVTSKYLFASCVEDGIKRSLIEVIPNSINLPTPRNSSPPLTLSSLKYRLAIASPPKVVRQAAAVGAVSRSVGMGGIEPSANQTPDPTVVSMLAEFISSHDDSIRQQSELEQWSKLLQSLAPRQRMTTSDQE